VSGLQPNFKYHGHNTYAYLLAKYGKTKTARPSVDTGADTGTSKTAVTASGTVEVEVDVDTFDFVTVQLYEGYSHAEYRKSIQSKSVCTC
jgi:hypothetical protein